MDKLTILGLLIALVGIMTGQLIEGSNFGILFQAAAFLIVLGGTLGAVMVQSPRKVFFTAMQMARWAFVTPKSNGQELIVLLTEWSALARREGVLALEARLEGVSDPFVRKGVQLLVDGHNAEEIREVMEIDTQTWEQLRWQGARVWEAAAGYSPTVGIIGAVMGLMHVMQNLSEPSKLGAGIAVAFVATIYGVAFANLLFLPVANKLKSIIQHQTHMRDMVVDGLCGVAKGENPRVIEYRLQGYLD
ncbi:MAG: flagellar motor protein [Gallionella sp.]|nr:flagellar motor protein [Gallionella sp.]MDD4945750.1 flagellar motor protein [Gallionella sp.]